MADQSSLEEKDVRLGVVDHVLDPTRALLDTKGPPLCLRHQSVGRHFLSQVLFNKTLHGYFFLLNFVCLTEGRVTCLYSWVSSVYLSL